MKLHSIEGVVNSDSEIVDSEHHTSVISIPASHVDFVFLFGSEGIERFARTGYLADASSSVQSDWEQRRSTVSLVHVDYKRLPFTTIVTPNACCSVD